MKVFTLNPKKHYLVNKGENFFGETDLQESIKSCTPGEWVVVKVAHNTHLAYVNPFVLETNAVTILEGFNEDPLQYVQNTINSAVGRRSTFGYGGARLFYGFADGLPGLIVDMYENVLIIQINTAGIDKYRKEIINIFAEKYSDKKIAILDNQEYRKKEGLPIYEANNIPEKISVLESGIKYELSRDVLQKVGYYYDHRENRLKTERIISRFNKKFTNGLDLFCYIGSWGMHLLRAGVEKVDFVDQANMNDVVLNNININDWQDRGNFFRKDVFSFLDEAILKQVKYDVIVCDPPSFTKSAKNKNSALSGYEKLYQKIFKLADSGSLIVAASCTQYISLEELDSLVNKAARDQKRKVQLLDLGIAAWDHPCSSLSSKSNYIKYLCFYTE